MRKSFLFIFILLSGVFAQQAFAQIVTLPPVFGDTAIDKSALKTIVSSDKGGSLIAIRVQVTEAVDPFTFFDAELWRRQVRADKFIENPSPDPRIQFASMFCALNNEVSGSCANKELTEVDMQQPWWIPVATVRAEYVQTAVANLTRGESPRVIAQTEFTPSPPVRYVNGQGPTVQMPVMNVPPQTQPKQVVPIVWDEAPKQLPIVWDDDN